MDPSQFGKGNWAGFPVPLEKIHEAAAEWSSALGGVERPWLCWNVSDRWCALQQRLIQEVGWTPVIGFDPRCGAPKTVLPGSIVIDFNARFGFPVMWPHFPLEFAFPLFRTAGLLACGSSLPHADHAPIEGVV